MYNALRYQVHKAMQGARGRRRALLGLALAIGAWVGAATPALAASSASFGYSPSYQYFTVPSGVYSIHFDVAGGAGADGQGTYGAGHGGSGAEVTGDFGVQPGWVLTIWAGGAGQPGGGDGYGNPGHDDFDGGSGGTGYGLTTGNGGGGGAASYVKQPNGGIVVLAGGGGGGGGGGTSGTSTASGSDGGYGAAALESNGWDATAVSGTGTDVYGGDPNGVAGNNGGDGGGGGDGFFFGGGGGGGGGGYRTCINASSALTGYCFGAGGGGQGGQESDGGGGGAGGNSYADPSATGVNFTSSGNSPSTAGQITLSYGSPSSTTVSAPSDSSVYGQSVRITAAVDPSDGGGTVTFTSNGIVIPGCANLSFEAGGGTDWLTSCTTPSLSAGTDTIVATYSGDRNYTGSSDSTTASVQQARSSTTLRASSGTSIAGQPLTFTASVTPTDGSGVVGFGSDGNYIPGCSSVALSASGSDWTATCTTSSLAPGTHTISATYSTDNNYANSNDSTTVTVQQKTSTVLKATPSTLLAQRPDRLIATVSSSDGGGTVAFTHNGVTLSSCGAVKLAAVAGGAYQAVCQLAFIAPGTYSILASYSGDTGSAPSSASATVQVNPAPAVLSVSPNVGPTAGGQTVTITGYYLTGVTKVSFGTTAATNVTVVSDSQLTATVPAHVSGRVNVTVTSSLGTSAVTSTDGYTYDAPPTVSSVSPASGPKGTVVTVTGTDLVAGAKVAFGKTAASKVVRISNTELMATAPAGAGTVPVTVTTAGGTSASAPGGQFTYSGS